MRATSWLAVRTKVSVRASVNIEKIWAIHF